MTPNTIKSLVIGFAVIIAIVLGWVGYRAADMETRSQTAAVGSPETPAASTPPATAPGTPVPEASQPQPSTAAGTAAPASPASPAASSRASFDIVRVEPNGDAVIAGRAAPGSTVELLRNGQVIATEKANAAGEFAMTPPQLGAGNHQLQLRTTGPEATTSERMVVVSVPGAGKGDVLVVASEPNKPLEILQQPELSASQQVAQSAAPAPQAAAAPQPSAPGSGTGETTSSQVRIGAVEVQNGRLLAQGTGPEGAKVRIHLNDAPVAEATVGSEGTWSLTIEQGVTPGNYRVRVDQLDAGGKVTARAEAPFDYTGVAVAEATPASSGSVAPSVTTQAPAQSPLAQDGAAQQVSSADAVVAKINTVSVKRGDSLWRISQGIYGQGIRYSVIYDANSDQIRNPDLIYPNQVFVLPSPN
jgi:nucleoid-associated protein YgaU